MAGPSNAVMGDLDEPTRLPETNVPDEVLEEEKRMAKHAKTPEFQKLKAFMEARIEFHRRYLPSGELVETDPKGQLHVSMPRQDLTAHWIAACIVVKEFEDILAAYENAIEAVRNAAKS